jgi:TPP-dependent pyruvate/acetoin dehydrogenase alpha subunit
VTVVFAGAEESLSPETQLAMRGAAEGKKPAVFVVEATGDRLETMVLLPEVDASALPRIVVDAGDVLAVFRVVQEAAAHGRRGQGPTLVVAVHFSQEL